MNARIGFLADERRIIRSGASVADYLALEEMDNEKYEFHNGEVVSMPGGTSEHSDCIATLTALLYFVMRAQGNRLFTSDMRVNIPTYNRFVYPDVSIVRGEPTFADTKRTQLLNPTIIIEVLSESTADYDRSEKFEYYRSLASLEEIAFFAQDRPHAELFRKNANGRWELIEVENGTVEFASVQASINLADIYSQLK